MFVMMIISRIDLFFISFFLHLTLIHGQCDETSMNMHMLQCYQKNIDHNMDTTAVENAYFMDGTLLCQAYNQSSSYRQCLYSIFDGNEICSAEKYPYSYQYSKTYWKLVMSSCLVENNERCLPSRLSQQILHKCHYSFDEKYPTKCKEFLSSVKCLEDYEMELIPSTFASICSRNKAYYYFYGDLAARLQLAINICENTSSS